MNRFIALVVGCFVVYGGSALAQEKLGQEKLPQDSKEDTIAERPVRDEVVRETGVTPIDREIALVRVAALTNQIDLAKLAYQKSSNEKVRQFASKLEAVHTASRDRLQRLAKTAPDAIVRVEKPVLPAIPAKRTEPAPRPAKGDPEPGAVPRKGGGTQDPSFGNKPDAGSLDEYNRNTGNSKGDSDEDRAQLKRALEEQSSPGTLDKKREVEKRAPAGSSVDVEVRPASRADTWVVLQQKIAAQRLENTRRELAAKGGGDFDACYLRMVAAAHYQMIDEDQVFADYVSSPRAPMIAESEASAMEHIAQAKALLEGMTSEKKGF